LDEIHGQDGGYPICNKAHRSIVLICFDGKKKHAKTIVKTCKNQRLMEKKRIESLEPMSMG